MDITSRMHAYFKNFAAGYELRIVIRVTEFRKTKLDT